MCSSDQEVLTRAGVAYQVRGLRFYDRPEVRSAMAALRRPALDVVGRDLRVAIRARWTDAVGYEEDGAAEGDGIAAGRCHPSDKS